MKKITLRIDENIDERIDQYNKDHNINNKQDAYRRIILSGLRNETTFDKNKVVPVEREMLAELKFIRNLCVLQSGFSKEEIREKREFLDNEIKKIKLIKEL